MPTVTEPADVILKVTGTTVCGSDLHLYHKEIMQLKKGEILGHKFMGIVDEVGPDVKTVKKGDSVVSSFQTAYVSSSEATHPVRQTVVTDTGTTLVVVNAHSAKKASRAYATALTRPWCKKGSIASPLQDCLGTPISQAATLVGKPNMCACPSATPIS